MGKVVFDGYTQHGEKVRIQESEIFVSECDEDDARLERMLEAFERDGDVDDDSEDE